MYQLIFDTYFERNLLHQTYLLNLYYFRIRFDYFEVVINDSEKIKVKNIINESLRISFFNKKSVDINLDKLFKEIEQQKITVFEASQKILSQI